MHNRLKDYNNEDFFGKSIEEILGASTPDGDENPKDDLPEIPGFEELCEKAQDALKDANSEVFKLRDLAQAFFEGAHGMHASLIYLQLARMVIGAITTMTTNGAEKVVLKAFIEVVQSQLDDYLEGEKDGQEIT